MRVWVRVRENVSGTFSLLSVVKVFLSLSLFLLSEVFLIEVLLFLSLLVGVVRRVVVDGGAVRALQLLDQLGVILLKVKTNEPRGPYRESCSSKWPTELVRQGRQLAYLCTRNLVGRNSFYPQCTPHTHT